MKTKIIIVANQDSNGARWALNKAGCTLTGSEANEALEKATSVVVTPQIVELVIISEAELGFEDDGQSPTREDIYKRAKEFGLLLCPPEIGPALGSQCKEQESNDKPIMIAMEPIEGSDRKRRIFFVVRRKSGQQVLGAQEICADDRFHNSYEWAFIWDRK